MNWYQCIKQWRIHNLWKREGRSQRSVVYPGFFCRGRKCCETAPALKKVGEWWGGGGGGGLRHFFLHYGVGVLSAYIMTNLCGEKWRKKMKWQKKGGPQPIHHPPPPPFGSATVKWNERDVFLNQFPGICFKASWKFWAWRNDVQFPSLKIAKIPR